MRAARETVTSPPPRTRGGGPGGWSLALAAVVLLAPTPASAQLNSDVGLSAGVMKRFTTGAASGVSQPGFGPVVDLRAHVALLPMIRIGLYVAYDHSPMPGAGDRNFVTGGLHLKVSPPLLPAPWKTYLFAGFGAGYAEADAYGSVGSLTGALLEIPLGLGLARKLGTSWELFTELGGRFGVATFGPMYEARPGFTGADSFALALTVGVSLSN